ncbi:MAG: radical SAM protein [Acidilobaceae archaeon]
MTAYRLMDWELRLAEGSAPRSLMVEVTSSCNYSCIHCFRFSSKSFKEYHMPLDLYKKLLDNAVRSGVRRIVFSGWGEPTTHPRIDELLALAKQYGFYVVLNTNGFYLEKLAGRLVELGLEELYVSIDAFEIELYSKIRRRGSLPAVVRGLRALDREKRARDSIKPYVKAIFTVSKANVKHVSRAVEFAKEVGIAEIDYNMIIPYDDNTRALDCLEDPLCLEELKKQLELASLKVLESGVKVWKPNLSSRTTRLCPFAYNRMLFVRSDGKVSPCIYYSRSWVTIVGGVRREISEVLLGDVTERDVSEIWRANSRQLLMLQLLQLPSCLDCELKDYCAATLSNTFDCWGNSPSCASCPYLHGLSFCPS